MEHTEDCSACQDTSDREVTRSLQTQPDVVGMIGHFIYGSHAQVHSHCFWTGAAFILHGKLVICRMNGRRNNSCIGPLWYNPMAYRGLEAHSRVKTQTPKGIDGFHCVVMLFASLQALYVLPAKRKNTRVGYLRMGWDGSVEVVRRKQLQVGGLGRNQPLTGCLSEKVGADPNQLDHTD